MRFNPHAVIEKKDRGGGKRHREGRFRLRRLVEVKSVAIVLAGLMIFSVFGANVSSIVSLLNVSAASGDHNEKDYYETDLTLYDYYSDDEILNGVPRDDGNHKYGDNVYKIFNTALIGSGYAAKAGTWESLSYIPLYLGLQYKNGPAGSTFLRNNQALYNYSFPANFEYEKGEAVAQGLVDSTLSSGYLTQGGKVRVPYFDENFLKTPAYLLSDAVTSSQSTRPLGAVYNGYKFRFVKNTSTGYYEYSSLTDTNHDYNWTTMGLKRVNKTFTAGDTDDGYATRNDSDNKSGFFPIRYLANMNKTNFGYGAKFEINFTMSSNGCSPVVDENGHLSQGTDPIMFRFSGDDDVWVFIDDQLVLDLGGAHKAVSKSYINFNAKKAYVAKRKGTGTSDYYGNPGSSSPGEYDIASILDDLGLYSNSSKVHKLTVFYMERGTINSNCRISFNFQVEDTLSITNRLDTSKVNPALKAVTKAVADKEAIAYTVQSKGPQAAGTSPDAAVDPTVVFDNSNVSTTEHTISFNLDGNYGSIAPIKVADGEDAVLPTTGPNVNRDGYYISGWKLNGNNPVVTKATNVHENRSYTAEWTQSPTTRQTVTSSANSLDAPKKPSVLEVAGFSDARPSYNNATNAMQCNIGSTGMFFNGTRGGVTSIYFNYNNTQYPIAVNDPPSNGQNTVNMEEGYAYAVRGDWNDNYYKNVVSDTSFPCLTSDIATWVKDYYQWYLKVKAAYDKLKSDQDNGKDISEPLVKYKEILDKYYVALPTDTTASDMTDYKNELQSIIDGDYDVAYENRFSDEMTTFYVYSREEPAVAVITDLFEQNNVVVIEPLDSLPSGARPGYPKAHYYKVTVPTSIIREAYTTDASHTRKPELDQPIPVNLSIECELAGTESNTTTINSMKEGNFQYPCYYDNEGWRDITETDPQYGYATDKATAFYVYSEAQKPTVKYSYSKDDITLAEGTATCKEEATIPGYYLFVVPDVAKSTNRTTTYSAVTNIQISGVKIGNDSNLSDNSVPVSTVYTASKSSAEPYVFFAKDIYVYGGNPRVSKGWHELVSVFLSKSGSGNDQRIHAWDTTRNADDGREYPYPNLGGYGNWYVWGGSGRVMAHAAVYNSVDYYYSYLPYAESIQIKSYTANGGENDLLSTDAYYDSASMNKTGDVTSSMTSIYKYSATAKIRRLSNNSTATPVDTSAIPPVISPEDLPDDPDTLVPSATDPEATDPEATDPEATDPVTTDPEATDPEATDPEATDPQTNDSETTDPETADGTPKSDGSTNGQFVNTKSNDGSAYDDAAGAKFKLYKAGENPDSVNGLYATRQVNSDGFFYIHTGETAKFSYQFPRAYGMKIAQTGDSVLFYDANRPAITDPLQINDDVKKTMAASGAKNTALYNRYSTTWTLTDKEKSSLDFDDEGVNVYSTNATFSNYADENATLHADYTTAAGEGAISFNNLATRADATTGVHLTATYTNTVRVGNLFIKKSLDAEAIQAIVNYNNSIEKSYGDEGFYDPDFTFKLNLYDVFGGKESIVGQSCDVDYTASGSAGKYYIVDNNGYYYYNASTTKYEGPYTRNTDENGVNTYTASGLSNRTEAEMARSAADGMKLRYSDVVDMTTPSNSNFTAQKYILVEGIPVQTQYKVGETLPTSSGSEPVFNAKTMTVEDMDSASSMSSSNVLFETVSGEQRMKERQTVETVLADNKVDSVSGVLADYYKAVSETAGLELITVTNSSSADPYLILQKSIDKLYYSGNDDPAGLLAGTGPGHYSPTFGGVTGTAIDPNGYQGATNAKQTFVFKITDYPSTDYSGTPTVFYETITFDKNDITTTTSGYVTKFRILKLQKNHSYTVEEITDWSWKYKISSTDGLTISNENVNANSRNGNIAKLKSFVEELQPDGTTGDTYKRKNAAKVTFKNDKQDATNDPERKVEGDTDIAVNKIERPAEEG